MYQFISFFALAWNSAFLFFKNPPRVQFFIDTFQIFCKQWGTLSRGPWGGDGSVVGRVAQTPPVCNSDKF